jgi:hypothetical protein
MEFDLKEVFSILDENDEGQIQLRRFVDVANNYYSDAEQLARITKALDPKKTGLINFDQFCHGIAQISSLQGVSLKDVASDLTRLSRENSLVEDSDQRSLNQDGSTTTFNEYDVESDEASHSRIATKKSPTINQNSKSISPTLDSPVEEFSGVAEPNSPASIYPRAAISQRSTPILKRNNHLQLINPAEEIEHQLQDSVEDLQKTVEVLNEQKRTTTDRLAKIQSENTDLRSRLLALEDRFHDLEGQQARSSQSDQNKYTEFINRKDQTLSQDKEILQSSVMRINAIEVELKQTQTNNGLMKKDVKQLKDKLEDVDIQLHESQIRCNYLAEDNEKLLEQLRIQREELEAEKRTNAQLAEHLTLESSREMFGHTLNRTESIIKTSEIRIQDLDAQVRALKLENEKLKHENEELRERAVASGYHEGRLLMANRDTLSYAAELEVLSKDELMSKLREQFMVNDRLREYIERMLSVIIENNPQLLEVATNIDMPILITSTNIRKPSFATTSNEKADESVPHLPPPPPSEPVKSNDKYCRLS